MHYEHVTHSSASKIVLTHSKDFVLTWLSIRCFWFVHKLMKNLKRSNANNAKLNSPVNVCICIVSNLADYIKLLRTLTFSGPSTKKRTWFQKCKNHLQHIHAYILSVVSNWLIIVSEIWINSQNFRDFITLLMLLSV